MKQALADWRWPINPALNPIRSCEVLPSHLGEHSGRGATMRCGVESLAEGDGADLYRLRTTCRIACCSCLLIGCGARAPRQHQESLQPPV